MRALLGALALLPTLAQAQPWTFTPDPQGQSCAMTYVAPERGALYFVFTPDQRMALGRTTPVRYEDMTAKEPQLQIDEAQWTFPTATSKGGGLVSYTPITGQNLLILRYLAQAKEMQVRQLGDPYTVDLESGRSVIAQMVQCSERLAQTPLPNSEPPANTPQPRTNEYWAGNTSVYLLQGATPAQCALYIPGTQNMSAVLGFSLNAQVHVSISTNTTPTPGTLQFHVAGQTVSMTATVKDQRYLEGILSTANDVKALVASLSTQNLHIDLPSGLTFESQASSLAEGLAALRQCSQDLATR